MEAKINLIVDEAIFILMDSGGPCSGIEFKQAYASLRFQNLNSLKLLAIKLHKLIGE